MILLTIIAFLVIFSLLILVHEWGHFAMARKNGIQVEEFGIGLPPRAKKLFKDKKGTLYSLNWVPFGGFVKMRGEDSMDPAMLKDDKSFISKTMWRRTTVILAGVFMNFVLAWFLISIGFTFGMKPFLVTQDDLQRGIEAGIIETENVLYVHEVFPDSSLSESGLRSGDIIVEVNGGAAPTAEDFSLFVAPDQLIQLTIVSGEEQRVISAVADGEGKLGFVISTQEMVLDVKEIRYPFYLAPVYAIKEVGRLSVLTVKMLGDVIVSIVAKFTVPDEVAGPVGIAKMTHYFVKQGFMALLQFTALISISLGVINVMPFPALDGGRFLFIIYEFVSRRRADVKVESIIHTIGFALLMMLIVAITWHDIANLFS